MQHTLSELARKSLATLTLSALMLSTVGASFGASVPVAYAADGTVKVTIEKYVDGVQATATNASSADFPMSATWNDPTGIGAGTGSYTLGAGNTVPYEAITADMQSGADYSTNEELGGAVVGADCTTAQPFSLVGYTWGESLAEAQAATPSMTPPAFTGITSDKYVIVWNHDCAVQPATSTVTVTINKYIDGMQATASSTDGAAFPMTATWNDPTGIGAGTGEYELNASTSPAYQAETVAFNSGSDYSTSENLGGPVVGANCSTTQPFALVGYTSGNTLAEAQAATPSTTAPTFVGLTSDKYVIVWNHDCSESTGTIGGDVTGGASSTGTLAVTSITPVQTNATADNTYEHGWSYVFNITIPTNEQNLSMKFADWFNATASSTLAAGNNMQISSAQADNAGAVVPITAANTYSTPALHMVTDLDPATPGIQVQVTVQVKIPANTVNGSYTTSYGVQTQP